MDGLLGLVRGICYIRNGAISKQQEESSGKGSQLPASLFFIYVKVASMVDEGTFSIIQRRNGAMKEENKKGWTKDIRHLYATLNYLYGNTLRRRRRL